MKRRPALTLRTIEFLPKRFFFLPLCETPRMSLQSAPTKYESTTYPIVFPATPGIRYVALDEQPPFASWSASKRLPHIDLDIHDTLVFHDFLSTILLNGSDSSSSSQSTMPCSSVCSRSNTSTCKQEVHYFYLRRRDDEQERHAMHLICRWRLLYLQLPPQDAMAPFEHLTRSILPWGNTPTTNLLDSLTGIAKGIALELLGSPSAKLSAIDALRGNDHLDLASADNGFVTWITTRFLVCASPQTPAAALSPAETSADHQASSLTQTKGDCISTDKLALLLKRHQVALVIRLNSTETQDDDHHFTDYGTELVDLSTTTSSSREKPSSSCLDEATVLRFLDSCENLITSTTTGVVAVQSTTGSGRAAACVGWYLMKHFQFTAPEAVAWLRFRRPGSVSRAHKLLLERLQTRLWHDGDACQRLESQSRTSNASATEELVRSASSMHISIGKISLRRASLFGTKDRHASHSGTELAHTTREPRHTSGHDFHAFQGASASSTAATVVQPPEIKRRPLTQGSASRRRLFSSRSGDGGGMARTDFALMHRFLHQSTGPSSVSRASTPRAASESASSLTSAPSVETTVAAIKETDTQTFER
ncbi:Dual specificity protein phosphatase, partial [Globisporangium splendens]